MIRYSPDRDMLRAIRYQQLAESVRDFRETGDREAAEAVTDILDRLDAAQGHPNQIELPLGD